MFNKDNIIIIGVWLACFTGMDVNAQAIKEFSDKRFSFSLGIDSAKTYYGHEYFVRAITIRNLSNGEILQKLIPSEDEEWNYVSYNTLVIEDMNFDGLNDIRLKIMEGKRGNEVYCCWLYDPGEGRFQRDTILEQISAPFFDAAKKTIEEGFHEANGDGGSNIYHFINGKATLVYSLEWDTRYISSKDKRGKPVEITRKQLTISKRINGKMQVVYDKLLTKDQLDRALSSPSLPRPD